MSDPEYAKSREAALPAGDSQWPILEDEVSRLARILIREWKEARGLGDDQLPELRISTRRRSAVLGGIIVKATIALPGAEEEQTTEQQAKEWREEHAAIPASDLRIGSMVRDANITGFSGVAFVTAIEWDPSFSDGRFLYTVRHADPRLLSAGQSKCKVIRDRLVLLKT